MTLGADFLRFLEPKADRLTRLLDLLELRGLEARVLSIAGRRHVLVRARGARPRVLLAAHYDRVEGSPGALDNSAACLVLANVAQRVLGPGPASALGAFFLFTDGEEAPATGGALSQGSYALGKGLRRVLGSATPAILVLDVVGRGRRSILSTVPKDFAGGDGSSRFEAAFEGLGRLLGEAADGLGLPSPLRLPLPWSDNLGFILAGLPALALSLLPDDEAETYRQAVEAGAPVLPWTWSVLHGPGDEGGLIEAEALASVEALCAEYCRRSQGGR